MEVSCGPVWPRVRELLAQVAGVDTGRVDCIIAPSMLGEQGLDQIAAAIAILVDAGCTGAADTLVRMCKLELRWALLKQCGSPCVERLRNSGDKKVKRSIQRALNAAAQNALGRNDVVQLLGLLPFCSEATGESVKTLFPLLHEDMVKTLEDDEFAGALRMTLNRIRRMDDPSKCVKELHSLLTIASNPEACDLARALRIMGSISPVLVQLSVKWHQDAAVVEVLGKLKGMTWREPTVQSVGGIPAHACAEVLQIAVELAAGSPTTEECVNRVRGLTALIDKIEKSAGEGLKSHLMRVVLGWLVQWGEADYEAYGKPLLDTLTNLELSLQPGAAGSMSPRPGVRSGKATAVLAPLAGDFRRAVDDGDLRKAALLIRDARFSDFGTMARERLSEAVIHKLSAAGYKAELRPFSFMVLTETSSDVEQEARRSVALQMAVVLAATGEPEYLQFAGTMLSIVFPMQQDLHWVVQRVVGEPQRGITGTIPTLMVHALPLLCSRERSPELDVILKMDGGEEWVARSVVDGLMDGVWNSEQIGGLFNELAYRVDLGPYLPALQTTVRFETIRKVRIEQVLDGPPLIAFRKLADWGQFLDPSEFRIRNEHSWARGWRFVSAVLASDGAFLKVDPMLMLATMGIDAAAADSLHGGADELLHRLIFPWAQNALDVMLQLQVNDKPLLSPDDLHNVLRAMMSHEPLGRDTLVWLGWVDDRQKMVELHAAVARALLSLADDTTPCRFSPERRAGHAAGELARMFNYRAGRILKISNEVERSMGRETWLEFLSKFALEPKKD